LLDVVPDTVPVVTADGSVYVTPALLAIPIIPLLVNVPFTKTR
jgi:hypothetical protein